MAQRDYYEILGISKEASADEIKKAYRRAAVKHHPDQGGDEAKFKEINEANEVLSNPEKKQRYDQFGHAGVGGGSTGGGGGFGGFGQGQDFHFDFGEGGLGDILGSFFGGSMGGSQTRRAQRGKDVEVVLDLSFKEAVFGVDKKISIELQDVCEHCKGSRAEPGHDAKKCTTCDGKGQEIRIMRTVFGNIQQPTTCRTCEGEGTIPDKECTICKAKGTTRQKKDISLNIPAGIDDGATIRLREYGEKIRTGQAGDLYVHVRVKPHKHFTREGDLILSEQHISMIDAALGTDIKVETVDGDIKMKVPAGTQSGTDFKLSNHGVPHLKGAARGAHIVNIIVDTPTKLSKKQKDMLKDFGKTKSSFFK